MYCRMQFAHAFDCANNMIFAMTGAGRGGGIVYTRRSFIGMAAATLLFAVGIEQAAAQTFPERAVKLIVGFPPGQTTDLTARMLAEKMSGILGQVVYVENRAGAGGVIAHEVVKSAPADGYTILITSSGPLAINPTLYRKITYDPLRDYAAIGRINTSAMYLATHANMPVSNLQEMIAYVKARPGKISYGSGGSGVTAHIAMEMLKKAANLDLLHIPYKGSPAMLTALIGGQVDFCFEPSTSLLPLAKAGRVKLLGISTSKRSESTPDVPTIAEQGLPEFEAMTWAGLLAPAGTPTSIVDTLNRALNTALNQPDVIARIRNNGSTPAGGTSAEFQQYIRSELVRWGDAVRASGAQVD